MQAVVLKKIAEDNDVENPEQEEGLFFNKYEWKNFLQEIKDMEESGKEIDIPKAMRNARYLAKLDKAEEDIKAERNCITFTAEAWEAFVNAQDNVS